MKAKLKKESDGDYTLALNKPKEYPHSLPLLSKQNCDEIFGVVDVEKLAYEHRRVYQDSFEGMNECIMKDAMHQQVGFKAGFNKAMEFNKDKQFTLEDLENFRKFQIREQNFSKSCLNVWLQSLQQPTEIEVEIEMEIKKQLVNGYKNKPDNVIGFVAEYENILGPKLDENKCLILKKSTPARVL
jgi:hypothetical protein